MSALALAGCERAAADRAATRPIAKVNGIEISAQRAPGVQALEKIIDRELLVQMALREGLDRDPRVLESMDDARRQVLAQAWVERRAAGAGKASHDEVRTFYADNPALFAERRVYRLRELAVSAPAEMIDVLRSQAAGATDLEQVAVWLKSRNAQFSATGTTQPAEQLPLSHLPRLARMKAGDIAVFATPLGASVIQLVQADDAPMSERQAAPVIEQFLAGRRRLEVAAAEIKRLREAARIEYVGEFKR